MGIAYPASCVLKSLETFQVHLIINEVGEESRLEAAIDADELVRIASRKLKDSGITVINDGSVVQAALCLKVVLIEVDSDENDNPVFVSYQVRGEILTEVMFNYKAINAIVADTSFNGCCEALFMTRSVTECCNMVCDYLIRLMKGS